MCSLSRYNVFSFPTVLAAPKDNGYQSKSSKDKSIEAWELELRASIEQKKAGGTKVLSKAEKLLVENQVLKEAETRGRVSTSVIHLRHAFRLVHCLMDARKGAENTLVDYATSLAEKMLAVMHMDVTELIAHEALSAFIVRDISP